MLQKLLTLATMSLSLMTASGVFIHDAHVGQVSFGQPMAGYQNAIKPTKFSASDSGITTEAHPHPEHQNNTLRGFAYESPSYPTRESRFKKFVLQNNEPRGRHAFDNYLLPLLG